MPSPVSLGSGRPNSSVSGKSERCANTIISAGETRLQVTWTRLAVHVRRLSTGWVWLARGDVRWRVIVTPTLCIVWRSRSSLGDVGHIGNHRCGNGCGRNCGLRGWLDTAIGWLVGMDPPLGESAEAGEGAARKGATNRTPHLESEREKTTLRSRHLMAYLSVGAIVTACFRCVVFNQIGCGLEWLVVGLWASPVG
jgi:hypothetical protein